MSLYINFVIFLPKCDIKMLIVIDFNKYQDNIIQNKYYIYLPKIIFKQLWKLIFLKFYFNNQKRFYIYDILLE